MAELLGGPKVLPKDEVEKLFDSRTRYGVKSRTSMEPGCPVVAEDVEPGRRTVPGDARGTDRAGGRSLARARRAGVM